MADSNTENTTFTPLRIAAIVALLAALGILGVLGTWQFSKYLAKRTSWATMNERLEEPPLTIRSATELTAPVDFRRVRLAGGELRPERSALVARRFYENQPGYWVITPYVFADGSTVLIQRGWVPEDAGPELAKEAEVPPGDALVGMVYTKPVEVPDRVSRDRLSAGEFELDESAWPVLSDVDTDLLYDALPFDGPRRPTTILLGREFARSWDGSGKIIATDEHVTAPYLTPGTHLGYATLWYGSALLLCWVFWAGWTGRLDPHHRRRREE